VVGAQIPGFHGFTGLFKVIVCVSDILGASGLPSA
jgi:hypothetical protein